MARISRVFYSSSFFSLLFALVLLTDGDCGLH